MAMTLPASLLEFKALDSVARMRQQRIRRNRFYVASSVQGRTGDILVELSLHWTESPTVVTQSHKSFRKSGIYGISDVGIQFACSRPRRLPTFGRLLNA